jgi:hypothetical protein
MTGYELMWRLYPEWYPENPLTPLMEIFLVIALLLIIPYIYINFFEQRIITLLKKVPPPGWQRLFNILNFTQFE